MSDQFVDYYQLLAVEESATEEVLEEALKRELRKWTHRQGLADFDRRQEAERRVRDLTDARGVLLNAGSRKQYDNQRAAQSARTPQQTEAEAPSDAAIDWATRAEEYLSFGDMPSANFAASQAVQLRGSHHEMWSIRGHTALSMGDWMQAEFSFNEAIRIRPDVAIYHFDLGCAYEEKEQYFEALQQFELAAQIEDNEPTYQRAIAGIYVHRLEYDRAVEILESAVRRHPDDAYNQMMLAWVLCERAESVMTSYQTQDDRYCIITSAEQAKTIRSDMERAVQLKHSDEEINDAVAELLARAVAADDSVWHHPSRINGVWDALAKLHNSLIINNAVTWIVILFIGLGLISVYGIGLVFLALAGALYHKLYRMPRWKANGKDLLWRMIRAEGFVDYDVKWGIGERPRRP